MPDWDYEPITEEYDGTFIHETDDAVLFLPEDWDEGDEIWLPKSQIKYDDHIGYEKHDSILVNVPEWLADGKGLI